MKLNERKHTILIKVVEDYIKDATIITSASVQDRHIQNISTATLRNELNALESMGFLKQLHTSSGRIPTAEGYKYYVSSLLEDFHVENSSIEKVKTMLSGQTNSLTQILSSITELVSKQTNYPTVMITNGYDKLIIEEVKIIPLIDNEILVLFRTKSGIVKNSIISSASEKVCDDAALFLTKKFFGKTIGDMLKGDILSQSLQEAETFQALVESLLDGMRTFVNTNKFDVRSNTINLLDESRQGSVTKTKKILNLLEDEQKLNDAIHSCCDGISVEFGDEAHEMEGCALITAPIIIKGAEVASIAVIGPDRMDYANIAGALQLVMSELKKESGE